MVNRGWVIDWSWLVCRGRLVGGLVLGILGLALVPDIGNIARVSISNTVGHNLGTAVREGYAVLSSSRVSIPLLVLAKVGSRVRVSNSVLVSVDCRGISMSWGMVSRGSIGWGASGRGSSGSNEASSNEGLKQYIEVR